MSPPKPKHLPTLLGADISPRHQHLWCYFYAEAEPGGIL